MVRRPDHAASRPADLAVITTAVQQHKDNGAGTDALWRAQAKVKELTQLAKQARKQAEKAAAAAATPAAAPTSEAEAVAALEEAMAAGDLTALKAAIVTYGAAAEDTDALVHAEQTVRSCPV